MSKTPRIVLTEENHKKRQHAAYMRQKRKAWTDQEIESNREQSKLRMRKRREKLKQEMSNQLLLGDTRQTRLAEQKELERKKLQAENKRKYRSQLSSQKKRRICEKDAAKKREKRLEMKEMKNKNEQVVAEAFSTEIPDDSDVHHPLLSESDAVDLDLSFSDLSLGDVSLTTLLESLDTESKDFFQTLRSSSSTWRRLLCMGIPFTVGLSRKTSHKNMLTVFLRNSLVLY